MMKEIMESGTRSRLKLPDPGNSPPARLLPVLAPALVSALILVIYLQTGRHDFVELDDGLYIMDNPFVADGLTWLGTAWAFSTFHTGNWHPLTWTSHMADVELFGLRPGGHHLTSTLLHLINALLLFFGLRKLSGQNWPSLLCAALFAVHPLNVESVAWAAERKNVLSTTFWLLSLGAYISFAARKTMGRYALALALFGLGLTAKAMLVTLPFTLLLLDWWPLGRMTGGSSTARDCAGLRTMIDLVREKLPFVLLSVIAGVVAILAQGKAGALFSPDILPGGQRVAHVVVAYTVYLGRALWPSSLAPFYPPPWWSGGIPVLKTAAAAILIIAATGAFLRLRRRHPCLIAGWLWFLGTLAPVIGLVQVGSQGSADRYAYVPLIGLFAAASWRIVSSPRTLRRAILAASFGAAIPALTFIAVRQTSFWRDGIDIFTRATMVTSGNWPMHTNLGAALAYRDRFEEALAQFRTALVIQPRAARPLAGMASTLARLGRAREAEWYYTLASRTAPRDVAIQNDFAIFLQGLGRNAEAATRFRAALALQPDHVALRTNLGTVLLAAGDLAESERQLREALRRNPRYPAARNDLGVLLLRTGRVEEAISHFREVLRLDPADILARDNLARALRLQTGDGLFRPSGNSRSTDRSSLPVRIGDRDPSPNPGD